MLDLVGKTLNRFELLELLGEGGMGAVFRGHDVTLQRDVAIKLLHPHLSRQADFQERFLQEARTAARLDHPSIVQVFDFGQADRMLYIVMEFIPGDNLRQLLKDLRTSQQWIKLDEAVLLIQLMARAIHVAHRAGVLHRDIKPANIMLKPEPADGLPYRPILTDLGLAKLMEGTPLTQEGTSMGTPPYMSPEQAIGDPTDARSDVYSLGILLYELAVGQLPFPIRSLSDAIKYHTSEPPPPPTQLYPELPKPLENVILKALAKVPDQRFPDAEALAQALDGVLSDATQVALSAPTTAPEGAVSLFTQYQASLLEPRGASLLDDFGARPADLAEDRLQILARDKTSRSVPLAPGMTLGRADDNQLVLDDHKASRHHARIDFDGQHYRIVDLNSTNGTLLANTKLLPGVPEIWPPEAAVRIGDTHLRLLLAARPGQASIARPDGTLVDPALVHTSSGEARIGVFLETPQLSVQPGAVASVSLTLLNQSAQVDHFAVSVDGIPPDWLPDLPGDLRLMPGVQQPLTFPIQPPRDPQARAGRYSLTLRIASLSAPEQAVEVKGALTLGAFSHFSAQIQPQKVAAGKSARIAVTNLGNAQEAFSVALHDRADELLFSPGTAELSVAEGQVAVAEFQARPKAQRWLGGAQSHQISAEVRTAAGQAQTLSAEVVSRALIPLWLPPLALFLCILLSSAAWLYYSNVLSGQANATATALAEITATAEAAFSGDQDGDGLTNGKELELGTDPTRADTDGDGVPDKDEVDAGTNPRDPDSDQDGLPDGEERRWGTNPQAIDSDGDTLTDGEEVFGLGTSPTNPDTDGDGAPDNVDPDPGNLPTPTPQPTSTATPTLTATSTSTPTASPTITQTPEPPHAPPITDDFGTTLYNEQTTVIIIPPGGEVLLPVMDLWSAPVGTPVSCASGFLAFTWIVRQPWPTGGQDLEFHRLIPFGGGATEKFAEGQTGGSSIGYCDELTLMNKSLVEYTIELRYASGSHG